MINKFALNSVEPKNKFKIQCFFHLAEKLLIIKIGYDTSFFKLFLLIL